MGMMQTTQQTLVGRIMAQWWDVCSEAGPKRRPNSDFSIPIPSLDVLAIADQKVKKL